jgi:methylase of polypeptide subunit release factors
MDTTETHAIGRHRIVLNFRDEVGPASAYSLLLAENIPDLTGKVAVDLGTGSGILAIVASLQGAKTVYLLDTYDKAISLALENGKRNGVGDRLIHLPIGASMLPLPPGNKVDVILSNPAQLPLPQQDRDHSPFYAGPDGRSMIDALIREAPMKLNPSGHLLMTHNSLSNLNKTLTMLKSFGLQPRILAERSIPFRPFIDRTWLDKLGGEAEDLYSVRNGTAYETLYVVDATPKH